MFPVLFRIPIPPWDSATTTFFPIRMFGVLVILGFLAGTWVVSRRLSKRKIMDSQDAFDFCFYLLASGIVGARLMYVVQEFQHFKGQFFKVFAIWQGGLVWYGGFALAALFAFWYLAKKRKPMLEITDAAVLGLALALAIGRWGCLCAGDDYGAKILAPDGTPIVNAEHAPWYALQFPNPTEHWRFAYTETPQGFQKPFFLYPVQLYMSLANFIVFGLLMLIASRAPKTGVLTASYFMLYPIGRFVIEYWRGDVDRGIDVMGTGLSFSQMFGIPVFLVGLMMLKHVRGRSATGPPPSG